MEQEPEVIEVLHVVPQVAALELADEGYQEVGQPDQRAVELYVDPELPVPVAAGVFELQEQGAEEEEEGDEGLDGVRGSETLAVLEICAFFEFAVVHL